MTVNTCRFWISSAVITVNEDPTSFSLVSVRFAVITIVSNGTVSSPACAPALIVRRSKKGAVIEILVIIAST